MILCRVRLVLLVLAMLLTTPLLAQRRSAAKSQVGYAGAADIVYDGKDYYLVGGGVYKNSWCRPHPVQIRTSRRKKICYHSFAGKWAAERRHMKRRQLTAEERRSVQRHDSGVFDKLHIIPVHSD
jgi:hypothetical protein